MVLDPKNVLNIPEILNFNGPENLHSLLDMIGYTEKYIPNLVTLNHLSTLLKEATTDGGFKWTSEHNRAFNRIMDNI